MKKGICVILSVLLVVLGVLPAFASGEEADSFGAYKHVFIIGVDGAGRFFRDAETPNFDRIFENGAVDYTARAENITVSAQNWGAILTGVSYLKHGLTNDITGAKERSSDTKYPSVFTYVHHAMPNAELASFCNWDNINYGIIENDIGVHKEHRGSDEEVADAICDYFNGGGAPALFFLQFDGVDHVGHDKGSASSEYIRQIESVDQLIGQVYDAAAANGLMEDGLFIVVADHGHTRAGGHGGVTKRETDVTVAAAGKTVQKGGKLDSIARNRDVAAIALYALGIERPDHMTSRVPSGLFSGVIGEPRPTYKDLANAFVSFFCGIATFFTGIAG